MCHGDSSHSLFDVSASVVVDKGQQTCRVADRRFIEEIRWTPLEQARSSVDFFAADEISPVRIQSRRSLRRDGGPTYVTG
jgi:hypothetical protein